MNLVFFVSISLSLDFDKKLASVGFEMTDEKASYDFRNGKDKSESPAEESSKKGTAPVVDKPPPVPPVPPQPNPSQYKTNGKQSGKPGTSLYRLISQKRTEKPNVRTNSAGSDNGKKVKFEDSFDSTEDDDLYIKKSSSSTEDETDLGENYPTTDDMDTQDDSFDTCNSEFSTDTDVPPQKHEPQVTSKVHHLMEEDTDGDDCSLSAFVPASVRRESILPQAPPQSATPQKIESNTKPTKHVVAPVPSAVRHQSTTNLRRYVEEDTSSMASSTSSLNSETSSNQSSLNETTEDEINEGEIDDFLDEALSDTEHEPEVKPHVTPVSCTANKIIMYIDQVMAN